MITTLVSKTAISLFAVFSLYLVSPSAARDNSHRNPGSQILPNHAALPTGEEQNPYGYIYGSVVDRNLIRGDRGQFGTNIAFRPRYASEIYVESVLFCGNREDAFGSANGPIVVTYQRVAHKLVRDVPCFDLVRIDRVESTALSSR